MDTIPDMLFADLPYKLKLDLRKPHRSLKDAFERLAGAVKLLCPNVRIESTARYSALYKGRSIVAYVEPQKNQILFGLFEDLVGQISPPPRLIRDDFSREWNSKPIAWFSMNLVRTEEQTAEIGYIVVHAYRLAVARAIRHTR